MRVCGGTLGGLQEGLIGWLFVDRVTQVDEGQSEGESTGFLRRGGEIVGRRGGGMKVAVRGEWVKGIIHMAFENSIAWRIDTRMVLHWSTSLLSWRRKGLDIRMAQ